MRGHTHKATPQLKWIQSISVPILLYKAKGAHFDGIHVLCILSNTPQRTCSLYSWLFMFVRDKSRRVMYTHK